MNKSIRTTGEKYCHGSFGGRLQSCQWKTGCEGTDGGPVAIQNSKESKALCNAAFYFMHDYLKK